MWMSFYLGTFFAIAHLTMNEQMWNSPILQDNLAKLSRLLDVRTVDSGNGKGGMAETDEIGRAHV